MGEREVGEKSKDFKATGWNNGWRTGMGDKYCTWALSPAWDIRYGITSTSCDLGQYECELCLLHFPQVE